MQAYSRFWSFIFLGSLVMFTAEVFAGSSLIWFIDPWALLVTFGLYLSHILFYYNVALRSRKFSLPHMYLWGMLFGLYEAPITKVLWAGYNDAQPPLWGTFAGVGILEFPTLVLFYHPVFAFIVPISVFQLLFAENGTVLPGYWKRFEEQSTWKQIIFIVFTISMASASMFSSGFNIPVQFLATAGSVIILMLLYKYRRNHISEKTLVLGDKGMGILVGYLILLYGLTTAALRPDKLPTEILPYVTIALAVIIILLLIFFYVRSEEVQNESYAENLRPLVVWAALFIGVGLLFGSIPVLTMVVFFIDVLLMPFIGIGMFITLLVKYR